MGLVSADERIGRRLKFRDLQVFFAVAQSGSISKAAKHLGLTQPAVSDIVGSLEHMFGVRLFDRTPKGVELTPYGEALRVRGRAVFDELKQGIRDIAFLSDPSAGELRIGCPSSIAASILPAAIESFSRDYPRVVVHLDEVPAPSTEFPSLHERRHDLVIARVARPLVNERDLNVEVLFQDPLVIATGIHSPWARRRKVDLTELTSAPWILTAPQTWVYVSVARAFAARKLPMPVISLAAPSALLRVHLLATGPFVTAVPGSVLHMYAARRSLKRLGIDLSIAGYPLAILTLKNRSLGPSVGLFIDHVRQAARAIAP
jgi:DNA-binding transcriptional LysR family regulator